MKNTKENSSLMKVLVLEESIGKFCTPYDTVVSLDGITQYTFQKYWTAKESSTHTTVNIRTTEGM